MKNVVILGGSYAGLAAAHQLLKQSSKAPSFKITLVTPNTHLYWNVAAPRALVPGQFTDDQIFEPIASGFKQYPAASFEFVLASAESIDFEAKKVFVLSPTTGKTSISYDVLVLATGSSVKGGAPLKPLESTEATRDALHAFQEQVKKAKTVVVAGAGVSGCEVAGELGYEYGKQKEIILIASGSSVLDKAPDSVIRIATKELQKLNVNIKLNEKITESSTLADGRQELTLPSGHKLVADLYIPTFGTVPNSSYLPAKLLNAGGYVVVNEHLQVPGSGFVWAIGDVSATEGSQYMTANNQATHAVKNIILSLNGKTPLVYKAWTSTFMGLQIGKSAGTGHFGSWRIPSFLVVFLRKALFTERMASTVNGSLF